MIYLLVIFHEGFCSFRIAKSSLFAIILYLFLEPFHISFDRYIPGKWQITDIKLLYFQEKVHLEKKLLNNDTTSFLSMLFQGN